MKRVLTTLAVVLAVSGLVLATGCGSSDEDFDPADVVLIDSFAAPDGTDAVWGAKILNGSSRDVRLQIELRLSLAGQSPFYVSPRHQEHLGKGNTGTYAYREHNVVVPPGQVMYQVAVQVEAD